MVALYVAGRKVGTLADVERLLPEFVAKNQRVEFRDDAGNSLGTFSPHSPRQPGEPLVPWDPSIDEAEIERRLTGEFLSLDELRARLGWK
ncbi:MAG: hypothetical protein U0871_26545 [Gemmataceae bacterium]